MKINFWKTDSGRSPVLIFMEKQDPKASSRMIKDLDHFEDKGLVLLADHNKLKRLHGYKNMYEIKTYFKGVYYRIIFTVLRGEAWLLEAFKKKSDDTPVRFIKTALARKQSLDTKSL
jgi:phage-related protein